MEILMGKVYLRLCGRVTKLHQSGRDKKSQKC